MITALPLPVLVLSLAGIYVLFSSFRYLLNIGLLERPLVIGLVFSLLHGEAEVCLGVALFFELFWMDLFPAGTFIPPQMTAATLAALGLALRFGLHAPAEALAAILAAMPLAILGAWLEGLLREGQNASFNELLAMADGPALAFAPGRLVRQGALRYVAVNLVAFAVAFSILLLLFGILLPMGLGRAMEVLPLEWWQLWFAGSIGGLLSIRFRMGYVIFGVAVVAVALLTMLAP